MSSVMRSCPTDLAVRGEPEGPGRRLDEAVGDEPVEDGRGVLAVAAERGGDALGPRVALHDQDADRVGGRDPGARLVVAGGSGRLDHPGALPAAGSPRARSPIVARHGDLDPDPELAGPAQQHRRLGDHLGHPGRGTREDVAGGAVDRDRVARAERRPADGDGVVTDDHARRPDHGRDPPAARDDRGVAHEPAGAGQDAGGPAHAVHVVGRGLGADEDDPAPGVGGGDGSLGREDDLAPGDARRGRETGRQRGPRVGAPGHGRRRVGEDLRHPPHGLLARQRERRVLGHLEGHPQGGLWGALAHPDLEHPEPALLDRELDVAAVAVVALEDRGVPAQLGGDLRHPLVQDPHVLGPVGARDHVLALGVEHDVAVERVLAGGRVAGEQHARPGVGAAVAEHHGLDGDARAQRLADALVGPVGAGTVAVPGAEHGLDRTPQLGPRVLRDLADAHDVAVDRAEPGVAVGREGRVARAGRQPRLGLVVQAQVEDGVHHPGHGPGRARADATPAAGRPRRRTGARPAPPSAPCAPRSRRRGRPASRTPGTRCRRRC